MAGLSFANSLRSEDDKVLTTIFWPGFAGSPEVEPELRVAAVELVVVVVVVCDGGLGACTVATLSPAVSRAVEDVVTGVGCAGASFASVTRAVLDFIGAMLPLVLISALGADFLKNGVCPGAGRDCDPETDFALVDPVPDALVVFLSELDFTPE